MKSILVYCGSNSGYNPKYIEAAHKLGEYLAMNSIRLIYGGGGAGLMGEISRTVISMGGQATGIIPHFINQLLDQQEITTPDLTEIIKVESMHERKALMENLADGIITLPGGYGSMDELCETLVWAQLDLHQKPVGLLNVNGYYDYFIKFLDHMVAEGFLKPENRKLILISSELEELVEKMEAFVPQTTSKWLNRI